MGIGRSDGPFGSSGADSQGKTSSGSWRRVCLFRAVGPACHVEFAAEWRQRDRPWASDAEWAMGSPTRAAAAGVMLQIPALMHCLQEGAEPRSCNLMGTHPLRRGRGNMLMLQVVISRIRSPKKIVGRAVKQTKSETRTSNTQLSPPPFHSALSPSSSRTHQTTRSPKTCANKFTPLSEGNTLPSPPTRPADNK